MKCRANSPRQIVRLFLRFRSPRDGAGFNKLAPSGDGIFEKQVRSRGRSVSLAPAKLALFVIFSCGAAFRLRHRPRPHRHRQAPTASFVTFLLIVAEPVSSRQLRRAVGLLRRHVRDVGAGGGVAHSADRNRDRQLVAFQMVAGDRDVDLIDADQAGTQRSSSRSSGLATLFCRQNRPTPLPVTASVSLGDGGRRPLCRPSWARPLA